MKIILENVQKGARVTGVAKILNNEDEVLNNVPINVSSKEELDSFLIHLLAIQDEFTNVIDGEYAPTEVIVKELSEIEKALNAVYAGKGQLEAKIITEEEYDVLVSNYKLLANTKGVA